MTEELWLLRRLLDAAEETDDPPTRKVRLRLRSLDAPWMEEDPDPVWCSFGRGTAHTQAAAPAEQPALPRRERNEAADIIAQLVRIADHFDPPPPDVVDSVYVSQKLGCTTTWIADQARNHIIPPSCVVPGTGDGKPWKFFRAKIEKWITEQR